MLENISTQEEAEKYINEMHEELYSFKSKEDQEESHAMWIRKWEEGREYCRKQEASMKNYFLKTGFEDSQENSAKTWNDLNFLQQSFFSAVAYLAGDTLDKTTTTQDIMDRIIEKAVELLPEIQEKNSDSGNPNGIDNKIRSYQRAIHELGFNSIVTDSEVFYYVEIEAERVRQRSDHDENISTLMLES